jgi:hypothetical protein
MHACQGTPTHAIHIHKSMSACSQNSYTCPCVMNACIHAYAHKPRMPILPTCTSCMHGCMHYLYTLRCTHAYIRRVHTHRCVHIYMHAFDAQTGAYIHTDCMRMYIHACKHVCVRAKCIHTCTHAHIHTYIHTYTQTNACMRAYACMNARAHA